LGDVKDSMQAVKFLDGEQSANSCPDCGVAHKLIVRTNRTTGHQFLGCPNWPDCEYTCGIPEAWKMRAMGQVELF